MMEPPYLNKPTIPEPWWPWPPPGAKTLSGGGVLIWHYAPAIPAVLGGWLRWLVGWEYGSVALRWYWRLGRPPHRHGVLVDARRHHGRCLVGDQLGLSSFCSAKAKSEMKARFRFEEPNKNLRAATFGFNTRFSLYKTRVCAKLKLKIALSFSVLYIYNQNRTFWLYIKNSLIKQR